MKNVITQFLKFGVVGVLAFLIDTGIMMLLHNVLGVHLVISNAISFTVSVVFNYVASMKFVFEGRDDISKKREFTIFVILSLIGGVLNTLLVWGVVDVVFAGLEQSSSLYELLCLGAKVFATAIVTVYNFVTRKIFLEKKA